MYRGRDGVTVLPAPTMTGAGIRERQPAGFQPSDPARYFCGV